MPEPDDEVSPAKTKPRSPLPPRAPEHVAPAPRVHPPSVHHPKHQPPEETTPAIDIDEALELVRRIEAATAARQAAEATEESPQNTAGRPLIPRDQKKFHKFGGEPSKPASTVSTNQSAAAAAPLRLPDDFSADAGHGITAAQLGMLRHLQAQQQAASRGWWVTGAFGVLGLLALAFVAGRWAVRPPTAATVEPTTLPKAVTGNESSSANDLIDQAMVAEANHATAEAIEYLEGALLSAGHTPGISYHLAELYQQTHQTSRALSLLAHSLSDGEEVAASHHLRGLILNGNGKNDSGNADLEKATLANPFDARYLFDWGEALRRDGNADRALVQLQRARERQRDPALASLYALKVRLTQLELGREAAFLAGWEQEIQRSPRDPAWLLTAAAIQMQQGHLDGAAARLNQLRDLVGEEEVAAQLRDPFLARFAHADHVTTFYSSTFDPTVSLPGGR